MRASDFTLVIEYCVGFEHWSAKFDFIFGTLSDIERHHTKVYGLRFSAETGQAGHNRPRGCLAQCRPYQVCIGKDESSLSRVIGKSRTRAPQAL
jgi:hypothetical protein